MNGRVGSLFSGIGGLDHGLARAGWQHAFLCESDAWRRGVLRVRFPSVPVHDDVRTVAGGGVRPGAVPDSGNAAGGPDAGAPTLDLICGGFPCQDLSVAGQRRGLTLEGGRSNLFFEFARVADALRPRWLLVENVPGLLSSNGGRDFGILLGTLADLGYGLAWRVLDSRFFGVPQRRRRVFIVGTVADRDPRAAAERAGQVLAVGSRCPRHPATRGEEGADVAGTLGGGAGERGWAQDTEHMTFVAAPLSPYDGFNHTGGGSKDVALVEGATPPLDSSNHGVGIVAAFAQNQRGELRESDVAMQLTTGGGKPGEGYSAVREGASVRRLTPTECERLQALPGGWTRVPDSAPDSRRYAGLGDAVTASVGEWIGARILAADRGGHAD